MLNKKLSSIFILVLVVTLLAGCGGNNNSGNQSSYIQIKGSDTIVNLAQSWSEEYMADQEETSISVTGGGSGTGIAALINDKVDIANSSRQMKPKEKEQAQNNGVNPVEFVVAMDGLSVIVNQNSPVADLTVEQIGEIFRGDITNWQEIGGPDQEITLYGRQSNSGTFVYFRDNVLEADYSANMNRMNGNAQIVEAVKEDNSAIGYVGIGYVLEDDEPVEGVEILNVAQDEGAEPATPLDPANIKSGVYPLARPLYQYTDGQPTDQVSDFIEYELSKIGQEIAVEKGFYPVTEEYSQENEKQLSQ
ncbi:PstS family phosphate ABC transporter substrate-binding protein [Halanaerobaculum tunisiense]